MEGEVLEELGTPVAEDGTDDNAGEEPWTIATEEEEMNAKIEPTHEDETSAMRETTERELPQEEWGPAEGTSVKTGSREAGQDQEH